MSASRVTSSLTDGSRVVEIQERRVGPRRNLVTVIGEVDHSTESLLQAALARTWESRPVAVAIDLREVTFLNAGGLRTLLLANGTARVRGVPLVLLAGPGQVTRLLTMVGLGEQLVSPGEARAVLTTASRVARPDLRLVTRTGVVEDPVWPAAGRGAGRDPHGDVRPIRAAAPPRPAGARAVAHPGDRASSPTAGRVDTATVDAVTGPEQPAAEGRATLRRALLGLELVARATGVLMERNSITADQALGVLTESSRSRGQSIVAVAEDLVGTRTP